MAAVIEHELWDEVLLIAERDAILQHQLAERLPTLPAAQRKRSPSRPRDDVALDALGLAEV